MKYVAKQDYDEVKAGDTVDVSSLSGEQVGESIQAGNIEAVLEVGDACTTEAGEAGTLQLSEVEGALVCVVNEEKKDEGAGETTGVKSDETSASTNAPVKKTFNGVEIVSDGYREVNGNETRHVKTADGAEFDLSEEEYAEKVVTA